MAAKRALFLSSFLARSLCSSTYAYISHPIVKVPYPKEQALALTKSQLLKDPPRGLTEFAEGFQFENPELRKMMEKIIVYARNYEGDRSEKLKDENEDKGLPASGYPFNLFPNIIKSIYTSAEQAEQETLKNLHFIGNYNINSTWHLLNGPLVGIRGELTGMLIKSKKPWQPFYNPDEVGVVENSLGWADKRLTKDDERRIFLSLGKMIISDDFLKTPPPPLSNYNFPYVHTLVLIDDDKIDEDQLLQRAILSLHGLLVQQARARAGAAAEDLKTLSEPECAQAIVTDGQRFTFLWYQLNTINLKDFNSGPRNFLTVHQDGNMYGRIVNLREKFSQGKSSRSRVKKQEYERLKQNRKDRAYQKSRKVEDFNDEILKTLLTMFLWN